MCGAVAAVRVALRRDALEIRGLQASVLGDSREHPRPDLFSIVERERVAVRVTGMHESLVRAILALNRPPDAAQRR
jgi:hypothetical protein